MNRFFNTGYYQIFEESNCTDEEQRALLDFFDSAIDNLSTSLARSAEFDLNDYETAKDLGINDFKLTVALCDFTKGREELTGYFQHERADTWLEVRRVLGGVGLEYRSETKS